MCVWWLDSHYANSRLMDQGASKGEKGSTGGKGGGVIRDVKGEQSPGGRGGTWPRTMKDWSKGTEKNMKKEK
jgi:hypothetical protein